VLATRKGEIKRTALREYASVRQNGIKTMDLNSDDELSWAVRTNGQDEIVLITAKGQSITCSEDEVRISGRTSGGVRGIKLGGDDYVVSLQVVESEGALIMVGGNGLGKKTRFDEFPRQGRGGSGVRAAIVNQKTGPLVAAQGIGADVEEIVAISANGVVIRVPVRDIKFSHRQAQGATLMKIQSGDAVVALTPLSFAEESPHPPADLPDGLPLPEGEGGQPADLGEAAVPAESGLLGAEADEQDGDVGGGNAGQA